VIPLRFDTDAWSEETRVMMTGQILERLESVPGALKVGAATTVPFLYYSGGISGAFNSGFVNDQGVEIDEFTCLNSLRDVEPTANLILDDHSLDDEETTDEGGATT